MSQRTFLVAIIAFAGLTVNQKKISITDSCRKFQPYKFVSNGENSDLIVYNDIIKDEMVKDLYSFTSITLRKSCYDIERASADNGEGIKTPIFKTDTQLELLYIHNSGKKFKFLLPIITSGVEISKASVLKSITDFLQNSSDSNGKIGFFNGQDFTSIVLREFSVPAGVFGEAQICEVSNSLVPEGEIFNYDCLLEENQYNKYFLNQMTYNWPTWYLLFMALSFVFVINFVSNEMSFEEKYLNNYNTLHPLYSIRHCASDAIFSKPARLAQLYLIVNAIAFFNALMTQRYVENTDEEDQPLGLRLTVFPIFSIIFSIFSAYFSGMLLNFYYRSHDNYLENLKIATTFDDRKHALETYEAQKYRRIFVFYMFTMLLSFFYTAMSIWFLYGFELKNQGWWLLQVVIAVAFDWVILDVMVILMARIPFLMKIFKIRGFWFDYKLHERYIEATKHQ